MTIAEARLSAAPLPNVARPTTVVSALVQMLESLGVREAFGVSGGAMAAFWDAAWTKLFAFALMRE